MGKMKIDWNKEIEKIIPEWHKQALIVVRDVCVDVKNNNLDPRKAIETISTIVNIPGIERKDE